MNKLLLVLIGFLSVGYALADANDFRCLKSIGLKKPLHLQFVFPTDDNDSGYVSYQNGRGIIPIKRVKEMELKREPGGRPSEFEISWTEITANGHGGTYVFVTQGALISNFRYIREDGKVFMFEEHKDAAADDGCEWDTK